METKYTIKKILSREIFDSRGNPTIETIITTANGVSAHSSVPSGASTGSHEAIELRDGGNRFSGLGIFGAIKNINEIIAPIIIGKDVRSQNEIDQIMLKLDGTENKSRLGANAILSVSLAVARLAAKIEEKELYEYLNSISNLNKSIAMPKLYVNLINGGKHTKSKLAFQEYMAVFENSEQDEIFENIFKVQKELREQISGGLGDEGGFIMNTENIEAPLLILKNTLIKLDLQDKVKLAMDVAASSFYKDNKYLLQEKEIDSKELLEVYKNLVNTYDILSIEDPFEENDFISFSNITKELKDTLIIGDDLTVTNKNLLAKAIENKSITGIIIKPNQIGTLTEVFETVKLAQENNIKCIVSHRSGETNDDFIADLAVGIGAYGIKLGAMQRGERIAKYNRLKEINSNLQNSLKHNFLKGFRG
ncbi:MAG: phosphopyruvate hydratase [Patescibacteria group bacterium]